MNPEIARLIAEANGTPVELINRTNWIFAERLAELIVRECAKIADNPSQGAFTSIGNDIRKHFGVAPEQHNT